MKTLKPPSHLGKHGTLLWRELTAEYRIGDAAGLAYVTTAAECLDRMREAQDEIRRHGMVFEGREGGLKSNPACKLETDARNGMLAALRALNLDVEIASPHRGPGRPGRGIGVTFDG